MYMVSAGLCGIEKIRGIRSAGKSKSDGRMLRKKFPECGRNAVYGNVDRVVHKEFSVLSYSQVERP